MQALDVLGRSSDICFAFMVSLSTSQPIILALLASDFIHIFHFSVDPNWATTPGLLAQGTLRADEDEFTVDFSKFIPTHKEVANRWSVSKSYLIFQKSILASFKNVAAANLASVDPSNIQAVQANKNFISWAGDAINQIDAKPTMMTSTSRPAVIKKNISGLTANRKTLNPILTTKSSSSQVKMSQQRSTNATLTKNIAGIIGSQDSIINKGFATSRVPQSIPSFLSKEALLNALPQDRRTYYVRVVPLDANGNCLGLPSEEKEVTVGKPIVEAKKWASLMAALFGSRIRLAIARSDCRPIRLTGDYPCSYCWYKESDTNIDWNQDLNKWCIWCSNLTNLTTAEWQISNVPFNNEELMNPTGLVARGKLNLDQADLKSIGCAGAIADLSPNDNALGHEFSIDFSKFAPARDPTKPLQIKYYLRVVALVPNGPGMFTGYSSPTRTLNYGQTAVQPKRVEPQGVNVPVFLPDVRVLSYSPIRYHETDDEYYFIATADNPPYDIEIPGIPGESSTVYAKGSLWEEGQEVYYKPEAKEKSWWDEVLDFFESIVDFFASIINWVSSAWNTIKGTCASFITEAICLNNPDCSNVVGDWVSAGIDTGLAAMGIPPSIPNFDQLASMGSDYMTKTLLATAGVNPDLVDLVDQNGETLYSKIENNPDKVKQGVDASIEYSASGGPNGLKPDPKHQHHPAYMVVEVKNNQNDPTLPCTLLISEPNHVFKYKRVAIPPLQPGEEPLQIPIVFDRVNDTGYWTTPNGVLTWNTNCWYDWSTGNPIRGPDWEICDYDWERLYNTQETFSVAISSVDTSIIDTTALMEQFKETLIGTYQEGSPLYIKYVCTGGTGDTVQITPNKSWPA